MTGRTVDRQVLPSSGPGTEPSPATAPHPVASRSSTDPASSRVASAANRSISDPSGTRPNDPAAATDSIHLAKRAIADCQERFRQVHDYTCTFVKREQVDGRLTSPHVMVMKARTSPHSFYFKFQQPNRGREAIFVHGRHDGRIVAHDVGLGKLLAGTMYLDPRGSMAMEENRHPVTEAGLGVLIDTVARRWADELTPGESIVTIHPDARMGNHPCTLIETIHPKPGPQFLFHKVKLYVDNRHSLPIRFEAYDWPKHTGGTPELVEEYSYLDLKINVGLRDHDFDPSNAQYSYGRL
jgi:hypothetical protein